MANNQTAQIKKVAEKAHNAVDKAAEVAETVDAKARETSANAKVKADETIETVKEAGVKAQTTMTSYVNDNPLKAVGIAFGAGLIASALLRK